MSPHPAGVLLLCALAVAAQAGPAYLETAQEAAGQEQAAQKSGNAIPVTDAISARAYEVTGFYGYAQQNQDCEATCAGQGKVAINGGRAGNALCYVIYEGDIIYYGTWSRVVAFQGPTNVCYYQDSEGVWYEDAYYGCGCLDSAVQVSWRPSADCISGSSAAARSPAVCRFHKYQDPGKGTNANYWMGWMDGDTCYTSNIDYGQNGEVINGVRGTMGGGNYNLQALCKNGPLVDLTLQVTGMDCDEFNSFGKKAFKKGIAKFLGKPNSMVVGLTCTPIAKRRKLLEGAASSTSPSVNVGGHLQLGPTPAGSIAARARNSQSQIGANIVSEDDNDAQQIVDKINNDPQGLMKKIQKEVDKAVPGESPPPDNGTGDVHCRDGGACPGSNGCMEYPNPSCGWFCCERRLCGGSCDDDDPCWCDA